MAKISKKRKLEAKSAASQKRKSKAKDTTLVRLPANKKVIPLKVPKLAPRPIAPRPNTQHDPEAPDSQIMDILSQVILYRKQSIVSYIGF